MHNGCFGARCLKVVTYETRDVLDSPLRLDVLPSCHLIRMARSARLPILSSMQVWKPKMPIQRCRNVAVRVCEVRRMRQFLRDNGLSVTLFALFLISLIGHAVTGWKVHVEELRIHELPAIG